jgi:iron complex transport system ATP-binding protein
MSILFALDRADISVNSSHILKGISLQVRTGELTGIIGPNGSGKSTLLRTMAGVLKPSSGSVCLEGREVSGIRGRELARRLAVVPQEIPIAFEYSVLEIVLMGRTPHLGRFEIEKASDLQIAVRALERAGLAHLADRKVGTLSGGERQRVMIARALAQQADILFLDEPTAHLDLNYQVEILHLVRREVLEHSKTAVVVLHDLNMAAEFCDRLVMLRNGEVFDAGEPADVITASNVQKAYGAAVWVRRHPTSGRPYVLSLGSQAVASRLTGPEHTGTYLKVHVVCGGGSGGPIFARLLDAGCEVTAGVVNIGESDQEAAESLGIEYVGDSPFSPISETASIANRKFIDSSDALLLGDVPFGAGNRSNLLDVVYAADSGKRIGLVGDPASYADRDFIGGEAKEIFDKLIKAGSAVLQSADEVCAWVAKIRGA